jgi:hypothetical protein
MAQAKSPAGYTYLTNKYEIYTTPNNLGVELANNPLFSSSTLQAFVCRWCPNIHPFSVEKWNAQAVP